MAETNVVTLHPEPVAGDRIPMMMWYPPDWIVDTHCMTLEAQGAHLRLLLHAWCRPGCNLPDDNTQMARLLGVTRTGWGRLRPAVEPQWIVESGFWHHTRLLDAFNIAIEKANRSRAGWKEIRDAFIETQEERCVYCGREDGPFQVDHIHPRCEGGSDEWDNLQILCRSCNASKGGRIVQ